MENYYYCYTAEEALDYVLENCNIENADVRYRLNRLKESIKNEKERKRQKTVEKHEKIKNEILNILPFNGIGFRPSEIGIKLGYTTSQVAVVIKEMNEDDKTIICQIDDMYDNVTYYRRIKNDEEWIRAERVNDNSEIAEKILDILPDNGKGLRPGEVGIQAGISTSKAYYVLNALVEQKGVVEVRYYRFSRYRKLAKGESWVPTKYASKI